MSDPLDTNLQRLKDACGKGRASFIPVSTELNLSTNAEPDDTGGLTALLRRWTSWSRQQRDR